MLFFIETLNYWLWFSLGFILLILELIISGIFLIWFGLAALTTGLVIWLLGDHFSFVLLWQTQLLLFIFFSIISVFIGIKLTQKDEKNDLPFLNNRTKELIGYKATLEEPIINGKGHLRIGDALWIVIGPDLDAGTKVYIKSYENGFFTVEPIE